MKKYEKISLDRKSPQHLYLQVFEKIKNMIIDGELEQHSKLPPIRRLASFLNVNNSTIVHSYNLLEREGYVYKKVGSGTFVSPRKGKDFENEILLKKYPIDETLTGFEQEQINIREDMISFASATPTYDLFPVEDFKDLLNEVLDRDRGEVFGYHESQGYYPLRKSLANYLAEYDIDTNPDHIQIISGAQQGIDIISKAFVEYNDTVLVESPTYTGAIATFQSRGAKIVPVRILEDGIDIRLFEESIQIYRPKLCYLMPNFQNPTGYSYTK
ncbi:MAG TPA: PLP-dependent aminotransferase family protein, partial [Clostridiales bacterium]|nr:PLP-dependent aminotransferase family protein [Clostridiales bacterium]